MGAADGGIFGQVNLQMAFEQTFRVILRLILWFWKFRMPNPIGLSRPDSPGGMIIIAN